MQLITKVVLIKLESGATLISIALGTDELTPATAERFKNTYHLLYPVETLFSNQLNKFFLDESEGGYVVLRSMHVVATSEASDKIADLYYAFLTKKGIDLDKIKHSVLRAGDLRGFEMTDLADSRTLH